MSLELWHQEEERAQKELEKLDPDNDAFKYIYHSTRVATEAYWKALRELRSSCQKVITE